MRRGREALQRGDRRGGKRLARLLQPVHRLLHVGQPRERVVEENGQRRHHLRQLVAERAALILGADRDRDGGLQLDALGASAARLQEVGERPGHDREHHVVDGGAERVPDELELVEAGAHEPDPAVRAGRDVERRVGWRIQRGPRHLADPGGDLARLVERLARVRDRAERAGGDLGDRAHRAGQPAGGELRARRLGLGDPRLAAVAGPRTLGREVEQHARRGRRPRRRRPARGGSWRAARSHRRAGPQRATAPTAASSGPGAGRTRARPAPAAPPRHRCGGGDEALAEAGRCGARGRRG